jgi:hypothetical protein
MVNGEQNPWSGKTKNPNMLAALNAVERMTGDKVIHAAFASAPSKPFDPHGNSSAWLVYRYPEHYQLIKRGGDMPDIYVECRGGRNSDKHFWVEASEVEMVRQHYERLAANDHS